MSLPGKCPFFVRRSGGEPRESVSQSHGSFARSVRIFRELGSARGRVCGQFFHEDSTRSCTGSSKRVSTPVTCREVTSKRLHPVARSDSRRAIDLSHDAQRPGTC